MLLCKNKFVSSQGCIFLADKGFHISLMSSLNNTLQNNKSNPLKIHKYI